MVAGVIQGDGNQAHTRRAMKVQRERALSIRGIIPPLGAKQRRLRQALAKEAVIPKPYVCSDMLHSNGHFDMLREAPHSLKRTVCWETTTRGATRPKPADPRPEALNLK